eukprot:372113_1
MKPWIDEIKNGIVRIINQLKNTYGIGKLRLSFIGYRDWNDNNNNKGQKRIEKLEFTSIETFESFIKNIKCIGGGDAAEDVLGGIKETLSISWKAPIRVLYHICDAAPHGTMYHNYFERLEKQNKYINDEMSFLDGISDSDTDSNSEEKNDNDNIYGNYSFGIRYYYHKYYKNNNTKREKIPGTSNTDGGNTHINHSYTYGDWYIFPKYNSLKDEITIGAENKLTIFTYNQTLIKAQYKFNAFKNEIKVTYKKWVNIYNIPVGSIITLSHILSVLMYTNHTELSSEFSRSFRKISIKETDLELKKRHCIFGNWGKLLRECVECFGTDLKDTQSEYFYHGLSCPLLFHSFSNKFSGPTSTSLSYITAVMFANQGNGNGIVIKIKNNKTASSFFNCIKWSDFSGESEMLFLGGFQPLQIYGLSVLSDGNNYDKWIEAINIFQLSIIKGQETDININIMKEYKNLIGSLINNIINNNKNGINDIYFHIILYFVEIIFKFDEANVAKKNPQPALKPFAIPTHFDEKNCV